MARCSVSELAEALLALGGWPHGWGLCRGAPPTLSWGEPLLAGSLELDLVEGAAETWG